MWVRIFAVSLLLWGGYIQTAAAQSESGGSPGDYTISVGDALALNIRNLGQTEYDLEVRVPQNGLISIPLIGEVSVVGNSVQQVEASLERKLGAGYLKQPEVTVSVTEYRPFYVNGAVESPGSFAFQHGLTVEKAIVLAGGLTEFADESNIRISQSGGDEEGVTVPITRAVKPGDVITVGGGGVQMGDESNIYLYGAVGNVGSIVFRPGLTVEKAIILAGGFSARASKRKITIRREKDGTMEEIKRAKLSEELQPGDIITVGESFF